jgi:hypothetical protein
MLRRNLCSLSLLVVSGIVFADGAQAKEGMVNFSSKGVSFSYPMSMGGKFSSKKVKAVPLANPDDKPDDVAPEHWEISFAKTNAHIYVIPTADAKVKNFRASYPTVADAAKDLGSLLKNKSAAPTDIPFLPWMDASSPIHSHVKYVPFKNGSGVRFLATYQIEPEVISNDGLIYSMQGLSADGKFYVSAMIPVSTKSLPAKSDLATWSKDKYDAFSKNFASYSKKEQAKLDKVSESAFTPTLAQLDELVGSIKVQ